MKHHTSPPIQRCKYRKPKIQNRKLLFLFLSLVLALATWGCRSSRQNPVVIFCSPDSPRMRQAIAGLEGNLKEFPLKVV